MIEKDATESSRFVWNDGLEQSKQLKTFVASGEDTHKSSRQLFAMMMQTKILETFVAIGTDKATIRDMCCFSGT